MTAADLTHRADEARAHLLDALDVAAASGVVVLDAIPLHDREACEMALDTLHDSESGTRATALSAISAALRLRWEATRRVPDLLSLRWTRCCVDGGRVLIGTEPSLSRAEATRLRDWLTLAIEATR